MKLLLALCSQPSLQIDADRSPVDAPRVLYHGTFAPLFNRFEYSHSGKHDYGWLGKGFYFTSSEEHARLYLMKYKGRPENRKKTPRILSVTVDPVKLYKLNNLEYSKATQISKLRGTQSDKAASDHATDLASSLSSAGFDGACYEHNIAGSPVEVVIFDPAKIHITKQDVSSDENPAG